MNSIGALAAGKLGRLRSLGEQDVTVASFRPEMRPLGAGFGIEAAGVDLSRPLSGDEFEVLRHAFFEHQLLVLRGQSLTPLQFSAFAARFGRPEPHVIDQFHHPLDPNILILSNRKKDGKPIGLADGGTYFHTDYSYLDVPARATTRRFGRSGAG
jgi:taurine dioxygenase